MTAPFSGFYVVQVSRTIVAHDARDHTAFLLGPYASYDEAARRLPEAWALLEPIHKAAGKTWPLDVISYGTLYRLPEGRLNAAIGYDPQPPFPMRFDP